MNTAKCLALIDRVKRTGMPLVITKKGEPVAQVVPPPEPQKPKSWLGCMSGTGAITGDVIAPVIPESE